MSGPSPMALPPASIRHRDAPFVGRAVQRARLRERWDRALLGDRHLVVLAGDAGMGKTRLASCFAQEVHAQGALVLWGRCTPEAIVPYEPVVEALRTALRTVSPEARSRVVGGRPALQLLLPDLADLAPELEDQRPEPGAERYVLFETVADLLQRESDDWPVLFVVDDVQWADQHSLRLLDHLLRHERSARVLVLATQRTVPPTPNATLDDLLSALHRDAMLTRLELGGLDDGEVAELLDVGGWSIDRSRAAALRDATSGNPFYVTELAAHGDLGSLPPSVRDVLGPRLDRLDGSTMRFVAAAAVAGADASFGVLVGVTGLDPDEALDAADAAVAAGVLTDEAGGALGFPHMLVQQAVLDRLSGARRSALHLRVADALAADEGPTSSVAAHLLSAGSLAPVPRFAAVALEAGRDALGVLAYEDAVAWADRVLARGGLGEADRARALILRSDATRALGQGHVARSTADAAVAAARAAGDPVLLAQAVIAVALAVGGIGFRFDGADEALEAVIREALAGLGERAEHDPHRSMLLALRVANLANEADAPTLRGWADEALAAAAPTGDAQLLTWARLAQRMARWHRDELPERVDASLAALRASVRATTRVPEMTALVFCVADLAEAGEVEHAFAAYRRLRHLCATGRQPVFESYERFKAGTFALLRGKYAASVAAVDVALQIGLPVHGVNAELSWAAQAFIRAWDQGTLGTLVETVAGIASASPLPVWTAGHAMALAAAGRVDEAASVAHGLMADGSLLLPDDSMWLTAVSVLAEVARACGDRDLAALTHKELAPYRSRLVVAGLGGACLGPASRYAGIAAQAVGELDVADDLLQAAIAMARRMGARPHVARALFDRSLLLAACGQGAEARRLRTEASAIADRIGMQPGPLGQRA
jgi:hypothetical protein